MNEEQTENPDRLVELLLETAEGRQRVLWSLWGIVKHLAPLDSVILLAKGLRNGDEASGESAGKKAEGLLQEWLGKVWVTRGLVTGPMIREEILSILGAGLGDAGTAEVLTSLVVRERVLWSRLPVPALARPVAEEFPEGLGGVVPPFHAEGDFTAAEREILNYRKVDGAGKVAEKRVTGLEKAGAVVIGEGNPEALVAGDGAVVEPAKAAGDEDGIHDGMLREGGWVSFRRLGHRETEAGVIEKLLPRQGLARVRTAEEVYILDAAQCRPVTEREAREFFRAGGAMAWRKADGTTNQTTTHA